jgi:chemotaxis protein methyltransferase CheR
MAADYGYLRRLVLGRSNNVLDPSADYLFDTRLSRLLRDQGMSQLEELVRHLRSRSDPALEQAVAEAMTINETSFFRDNRLFELLRTSLLPELIERRRPERRLRFWSAACSTGQEALSLAMLVRERFPELAHWTISIEGTDICGEAVARARAGWYQRIEVNRGLPARYLVKYFEQTGDDWWAKSEIRSMCNFRQANLCACLMPFSERFDVVLLRNVMLYFSTPVRVSLLNRIHRLTASDGMLALGSSEQTGDSPLWAPVLAGGTCYYRPRNRE